MNKAAVKIVSAILALTCVVSLGLGLSDLKDINGVKGEWEETGEATETSLSQLEAGIIRLEKDESAYLEGAEAYNKGLGSYEEGEQELNKGGGELSEAEKEYNRSLGELAEARKAYNAAKSELDANKAALEQAKRELAAAKAELEANRAAYEEGKAELANIEPIYNAVMPLYQEYLNYDQQYQQAVDSGNFIAAAVYKDKRDNYETLVKIQLNGYSIESLVQGYEQAKAKIAAYEQAQAKAAEAEREIADAEQKLAENEQKLAEAKQKLDESEAQLAAAKRKIDQGKNEYNDGKNALDESADALAAGMAQLDLYEGGESQIAAGLDLLIAQDTYYDENGKELLKSIAERLGYDFSYWRVGTDGMPVIVNGEKVLDLVKAQLVVDTARDFKDEAAEMVAKELGSRTVLLIVELAACLVGIAAAIFGFVGGVSISAVLGVITVLAAIVGIVASAGKEYPFSVLAGWQGGGLVVVGFAAIAVAALLHSVVAFLFSQKTAPAVSEAY